MMVSPEWYYEENLKGKTTDQIREEIFRQREQIAYLQAVVANPQEHMKEWMIKPDPKVRLQMHRSYMQRAIDAFWEADEVTGSKISDGSWQ